MSACRTWRTSRNVRHASGMRGKADVRRPIRMSSPFDGGRACDKLTRRAKFRLTCRANHFWTPAILPPKKGALAIVTAQPVFQFLTSPSPPTPSLVPRLSCVGPMPPRAIATRFIPIDRQWPAIRLLTGANRTAAPFCRGANLSDRHAWPGSRSVLGVFAFRRRSQRPA